MSETKLQVSPTLLLAPTLFLAVVLYHYVVYPLFASPLRKIPAANPLAAVSSLWINWRRHQRTENAAIHSAHKKYGPVVRLGPNEISVNCFEGGIKTVYSGGFEKDIWYTTSFKNYGFMNMFATAPSKPHSGRKRMLSNIYSKSILQSSPTMHAVSKYVIRKRLLPILDDAAATSSPVDLYFLLNRTTMDLVTGYQFGIDSGSNFLQNEEEAKHWLHLYHCRRSYTFWPSEHPRYTSFWKRLGINLAPAFVDDANQELEDWGLRLVDSAEAKLAAGKIDGTEDPLVTPVVYKQLKSALLVEQKKDSAYALNPPGSPLRLQMASELLDHFSAGHETSAVTLTFLFHELAQRPSLQQALRDELLTLEPRINAKKEDSDIPSGKDLDSLPLLHVIVMETLRRHAAIPGPQPRTTPENAVIGPYSNIPAGVRISAQALSLHRNEKVFPRAEDWIPERWISKDDDAIPYLKQSRELNMRPAESHLKEMHRWFWAFGSGGRMCIGSNLAMQQMKLIIAAILTGFQIEIVDDEGIEQEDAYTAHPKGGKLIVQLKRWSS